VVLTSADPVVVLAVRSALERVFGLSASLRAVHTSPAVAAQVVGLGAARKAAGMALASMSLEPGEVAIALCPLVDSAGLDGWVSSTLMVLQDEGLEETVEAVSQAVRCALLCFAFCFFFFFASLCLSFALLCFALVWLVHITLLCLSGRALCFALLCFALLSLLCFALLCFALLCFALLCLALLCFALLCFD
jgi:hypothetical protein